ncbi:Ribonuclease 3 [uncultured Gammaproteobacteria bacterium]
MSDPAAVPAVALTVEFDNGLSALEVILGHRFVQPALLAEAVTHPSVAGTCRGEGTASGLPPGQIYERLEFLGDRVLGLVMAEWLLERSPTETEGMLAKRHAAVVRREALGRVADEQGIGRFLRLSRGEEQGGGRGNPTILADACEAMIGALYLDGGLDAARGFIRGAWAEMISGPVRPPTDPKSELQEWAQARGLALPRYTVVRQSGPAHAPEFEISVAVDGVAPASGVGPSRRVAEKAAAIHLLREVGVVVDE